MLRLTDILRSIRWRYIVLLLALLLIIHVAFDFDSYKSYDYTTIISNIGPSKLNAAGPKNPYCNDGKEEYLAMVVQTRDQGLDLPEFMVHHYHHMNVSRFYILDDRSDPPLDRFEYPGIPASAITFVQFSQQDADAVKPGYLQHKVYDEAMRFFRSRHTWVAFMDPDEFFEIKTDETLEGILRNLDKSDHIGALVANWRGHTSNGHLKRVPNVRQSYTQCMDADLDKTRQGGDFQERHVKSIVKTKFFQSTNSPHMFDLHSGAVSVGEDEKEFGPGLGWRFPVTYERLAVHHYSTKSREEYSEKMTRWKEFPHGADWSRWDKVHEGNLVECKEMTRYHP